MIALPPTVVTPGNHDGVHLGHRALVSAARELAARKDAQATALFFDPHSTAVLAPKRAPELLTTPSRRAEILRRAGADRVAIEAFDLAFARQSPEEFVQNVLVDRLSAVGVVVGPDFQFGHKRAGDIDTLRRLGEAHGFEVVTVDPVLRGGEPVSSTRIRRVLAEGDVGEVAAMLTRVHDVTGGVVRGDERGRTIGFPTANLDCEPVALPADGVYAVMVRDLDGDETLLPGVANLGVRPTFAAGRSVEVHLLDFEGDLYGHRLRVGFAARVRPEQKFDGLDALVAQIRRDVQTARGHLEATDRELFSWM